MIKKMAKNIKDFLIIPPFISYPTSTLFGSEMGGQDELGVWSENGS